MGALPMWVRRRQLTLGLAIFFVVWYSLQLSISHVFGEEVARWWFDFEHPPELISAGIIFAPLSHDVNTLTHITGNFLLLFTAGGVAEPHIGKERILVLVIGLGYLSIYLANVTVTVHHNWMLAGASGGVLALWAYAGLRMRHHAAEYLSDGVTWSRRSVEAVGSVVLLLGIPAFFFHQLVWIDQPHSGHIIGLILGVVYYIGEPYLNHIKIDISKHTQYRQ